MKLNSSNPVILQQKIIHLQAELEKYKSSRKEKLLFENQKLHAEVERLREENAALKEQLGSRKVGQNREEISNSSLKRNTHKINTQTTKEADNEINNSWFLSNLVHESKQKNK